MNYFKTSTLYLALLIIINSIYLAKIDEDIFIYYPIGDDSFNFYRSFTCMFIHASKNHLVSNIIFLMLFGFSVEKRIGWGASLWAFSVGGILSVFFYNFFVPMESSLVGCSGGVSVFVGILWTIFIFERIWEFVLLISIYMYPQIDATLLILKTNHSINNIAYPVHFFGFIFGILFYLFWRASKAFPTISEIP